MSGSIKNDWNRFLNGSTSHYNFNYRSETTTHPTPIPTAQPIAQPTPNKNDKNRVVIPTQKGGKRKSRRHTKKYRHSRRN
jgi:hypothetical protein